MSGGELPRRESNSISNQILTETETEQLGCQEIRITKEEHDEEQQGSDPGQEHCSEDSARESGLEDLRTGEQGRNLLEVQPAEYQ